MIHLTHLQWELLPSSSSFSSSPPPSLLLLPFSFFSFFFFFVGNQRYDPEDKVTTYSIIAGMVIMALSLVLFAAEDPGDAVVSNATAGQAIARAIANVTCVGNECPGK